MDEVRKMHQGQSTTTERDATALFRQYQCEPTEALRNELTVMYLHIARIIAHRFSGKGVEYDDLYQVASLALIKAVERFDPDYGVLFQSYATPKMVGEVKNYFRDKLHMLNMPRRAKSLVKQIEAARTTLMQSLMRQPTMAELVDLLGLPETEVVEAMAMQGAMYPGSLDAQQDDDAEPLSDYLGEDEPDFDRFELHETMEQLLSQLPETEQRVLRARYFGQRSQRDVAEELGVSQMTISRTERAALTKLRRIMADQST